MSCHGSAAGPLARPRSHNRKQAGPGVPPYKEQRLQRSSHGLAASRLGRYEKWKDVALEYAFLLQTAEGWGKHGHASAQGKRHAIAKEGGVDIDSLSLLQRILLISDGTITDAIEAAYLEPVHLVKLGIHSAPALADVESLDLKAGELLMQRDILLRGATSGNNYVYARTLIALDKLDPNLRRDLIETDNPIGRLWVQYKLETRKEILKIWRLPAGRLSRHFGHAGSAGLLARTYRVISGGRPVMAITEYFPLEPGADGNDRV